MRPALVSRAVGATSTEPSIPPASRSTSCSRACALSRRPNAGSARRCPIRRILSPCHRLQPAGLFGAAISDVAQDLTTPGLWLIYGTDELDEIVGAAYSEDLEQFVLVDQVNDGSVRNFAFNFTGSDTVSGCYRSEGADGSLSECFDMTGVRTSSSGGEGT